MNYCQRCGREVPDNIMVCNECMGFAYQTVEQPRKKGLPAGAIVGIVLGSVAVVVGIIVAAVISLQVKLIDITDSDMYMNIGDEHKIEYVLEPANALQKDVTFTSSDTDVATVDQNGRITAKRDGEVTIEVTTKNGHTDSMNIVVSQLFDDWKWDSLYSEADDEYYYNSIFAADLEITGNRFELNVLDTEFTGTWEFDEYDGEYTSYIFRDDEGGYYSVIMKEDLMCILLVSDPGISVFFYR